MSFSTQKRRACHLVPFSDMCSAARKCLTARDISPVPLQSTIQCPVLPAPHSTSISAPPHTVVFATQYYAARRARSDQQLGLAAGRVALSRHLQYAARCMHVARLLVALAALRNIRLALSWPWVLVHAQRRTCVTRDPDACAPPHCAHLENTFRCTTCKGLPHISRHTHPYDATHLR